MKKKRIFVALHNYNWEKPNLIWTLQNMFNVYWFDWGEYGYAQYNDDWSTKKSEMNKKLVDTFIEEHTKEPFDLFFGYLSDPIIEPWVIDAVRTTGVYAMNFGCNNVGSFLRANRNIGKHFDVTWTVDKVSVQKFTDAGMPVIYAPLAINPQEYLADFDAAPVFDVGLVGRLYGYRRDLMAYLREKGELSMYMASGVKFKTMAALVHTTACNIIPRGIGDARIDDHAHKQIRLRDFEVTAMGGLSVSEDYPDLHDLFEVGKEVITYEAQNVESLIEICKEYSQNKEKRDKIRKAGYKRCVNEHTWEKRFKHIFKEVGIL